MKWEEIKSLGSSHYKVGSIEPIDLIKAGGMIWEFSLGSIIKYAYRIQADLPIPGPTIHDMAPVIVKDLDKIIHYANMLKCCIEEGLTNDWLHHKRTKEAEEQLRSLPTPGHRLGTKSNR